MPWHRQRARAHTQSSLVGFAIITHMRWGMKEEENKEERKNEKGCFYFEREEEEKEENI